PPEKSSLSLHDALPIYAHRRLGEEVTDPAPRASPGPGVFAGAGCAHRLRFVRADGLEQAADGISGVQEAFERFRAHLVELDVGDHDAFLRTKDAVHRRRRDLGRRRDLLDRDGAEPSLVEQVEGAFLDGAHGLEPPALTKSAHASRYQNVTISCMSLSKAIDCPLCRA